MGSQPNSPDSRASLDALIASATPGGPLSGELLRYLRPSGVMGDLGQMPLTEILQNLDFGKKSARVDVWFDGGEGAVVVHDGQIVSATASNEDGGADGEAAVLALCRRSAGVFRIQYAREDVDRNVHRPTTFVLLEALRVIDEASGRADAGTADAGDDGWSTTTGSYAAVLGSDAPAITAPPADEPFPPFPPFAEEPADRFADFDAPTMEVVIEVAAAPARPTPPPPAPPSRPVGVVASGDPLLDLIAEGERLVAAGDIESAKQVLSQGEGLVPRDDLVRRKLLSVNEAIDAAQANALLDRAMRGGPDAVEFARRAGQLRPVRDVLLRALAVFARNAEHDDVADCAEQLLELDPDDEGALRTLLDANVAQQHWGGAVRAAESLLRRCPGDEQVKATLQKVSALARRR